MQTRLLTPIFAGLLALPLVGCGDDKGGPAGSETDASSTGPSDTTMVDPTTPTGTTTDEPDDTTMVDPTTPTTTIDEPETSTTIDMTTGEPADCAAPADDADEDSDGVVNSADNCRCDANPNQLDYDGNTVGNVCDQPLEFTIADGVPPEFNKLDTTARAEKGLSCEFAVALIVVNGTVQVTLDDAGQAKIWAARLNFADTPELECDLTLLKVKLRIEQFFAEATDMFSVGFPFTIPDHDAGTITGQGDMPQNILVSGIINVTQSSNEGLAMPGPNPIEMVPGAFPPGFVTVADKGAQVSVTFDDEDSIVFEQTTMSDINIKLTGLKGTLRLKK